ncbi:MAG: MFS transporter [Stappiaceae bacterium]
MTRETVQSTLHKNALIGTIWLSSFLVSLDYTAVTVALPTIAQEFNAGTSLISWASLTYMIVMAALMFFAGPVIARFGYRKALSVGLCIFVATGIACALSPALWLLFLMRGLQGVGAAIMIVLGSAVIKTLLPLEDQSRAFAIYATGPMAGLLAGPTIGGELVYLINWQSIFLINIPISTVTLLLARSIPADAGVFTKGPTADISGVPRGASTVVLGTISLFSFLVALNQGAEWGWLSPGIVSFYGLCLLSAIGCFVSEHRSQSPLLDPRFASAIDFNPSVIALFFVLLQFGAMVFLLPFYFQWLRNLNPDTIGIILATQPLATILMSILLGVALGKIARRTLSLAGIVLLVLGAIIFALAQRESPLLFPIGALILIGAGAGLYFPSLFQLSMSHVPDRHAASASSIQSALRIIAQMLGVVIFETIFSGLYPEALNADKANAATGAQLSAMQIAFQFTFWCAVAVAALALIPAWCLSHASKKSADK